MKTIRNLFFASAMMCIALSQTGCFGSFELTKKVYVMNKNAGEKFVQEGLFLLMNIIPVYGVAATVDVLFLNLIEFWSGSNPIAMKEGQREIDMVQLNGNTYQFVVEKDRFILQELNESAILHEAVLLYDDKAWFYSEDGLSRQITGVSEDGYIQVFDATGNCITTDKKYEEQLASIKK